ncbi:MAG: diaminopimelate decarboxylase [Nitrospinota bacterium]|nr:diaminopimelate decarboxylase [Nitrospinota bacterium]MDH5757138.1 diaminopimelate decarboxylase [Nitrospinota bacterium]
MHHFDYKDGQFHCEDVPLAKIAEEVGTPFYCYSHATLLRHFTVFDQAFAEVPHLVCFAVKANSNLAVVRLFAKAGGGADIVSGGELYRAQRAGVPAEKIVYAGVGKTRAEIETALKAGILMFNVESSQELLLIDSVAGKLGVKAPVALRVNPDVDPQTHPYISTGLKQNKFGISIELALEEYRHASRLSNIEIVGMHKHIGSQITLVSPFADALEKTLELVAKLREEGINIRYVDIGGGLGITYNDEAPPHPEELAKAIVPMLKETGCTIVFEPGRVLVGNAGALVTQTLFTKINADKTFIIVDAAMNDLARPSLYGSYQHIVPVLQEAVGRKKVSADVVGPICESGDFLAKDRVLPEFRLGELMAVMSAGAYGFTMSSNYNSRPRVPEVLVNGATYDVIRTRETMDDLVRGESIPAYLE